MNNDLTTPEEFPARPHPGRTLHDYLRVLFRRRWAVLGVLAVLVATTALYSFTAAPIYQATVQILIERTQPQILDTKDPVAAQVKSEEFYQTQYKLLESRALAKKVADKLKLHQHPLYADIFQDVPAGDRTRMQQAEERLVDAIRKNLEVSPIRNSSLVDVSFAGPDPQLATRVVNTLAQAYIEQSLDLRFEASQEAAAWLQQKLAEARRKLEDSEAKLNQYKREHQIVALEDKESITAQKLEQLNRELVAAQTRRLDAETKYREVSAGNPIPEVLNNPLIQTLISEEAKIIAQLSELNKKYGPKHPRMIQLNQELAAARGKIAAENSRIVQSIKNAYQMALNQEENLKKALEEQKNATQDLDERGIQYRVLLRDVETNRALYENMLKSLKETTATENLPATNIRIVYAASVPDKPVKPKKARNILLAAVLGLFLGVAAAFGLENLDTTLKTPEEVESWLEVPSLAMIPHLDLGQNRDSGEPAEIVVLNGKQPLAAEAYRGLRTSILFSAPGQAPKTLLVTSSLPLEGKTLTAANLAAVMAQAEGEVLLVDADLRRPTVHQIFHLDKEPGLSNFLVGGIDDLPVRETPAPKVYVVTCGKVPPNPSELLGSARMREFLDKARSRFNRIIIDSPPLMSVTDAAILSTMADGVLLVVKAEAVPRQAALEARNDLLEVKAPLLGALLNNVPLQRDGYYNYYYNYYYRYRSYYGQEEGTPPRRRKALSPPSGLLAWLKGKPNRGRGRESQRG
ncbi:MAG: polysaccharide biosynthesis tyrosine autokinase [Deltaproteobacteria bacterium]|nr:polysaccharide biosynthesis tyrosine autokinase [Desulfitobacteriaceae bacterium]MDI6855029.1 polysaccharide biosynthesis tyrosine autokinase [Deltaproteobacteria bacterium]